MRITFQRRWLLWGGACFLAILGLMGAQSRPRSAPAGEPRREAAPGPSERRYLGALACKACHEKWDKEAYPDPCCQMTEYDTWKKKDKHAQAYTALTSRLSQDMASRLGLGDDIKTWEGCLNCHAMNFPPSRQGVQFHIQDGVTCDGCHGPAKDWFTEHTQKDIWRKKTPQQKADLGFIDVRGPAKRAALCTGCHIGNAREGKVLTHDMYAAGHPPLPSIEIATFSEDLPRHWVDMDKKSEAIQKIYQFDPSRLEQAETVIVGGMVVLRDTLELNQHQASARLGGKGPEHNGPEFAQFDCYACHHELRPNSWRQHRAPTSGLGRPAMTAWPATLAPLAVHLLELEPAGAEHELEKFRALEKELEQAFARRPFGEPGAVVAANQKLIVWTKDVLQRLARVKVTQADALRLLGRFADLIQHADPDYDSARQLVWAYQRVYSQVTPKPKQDAAIQRVLQQLTETLDLELPSGKNKEILTALPRRFTAMRQYDPAAFKKSLAELSRLASEP
jgi:hypothetical protein